MVRTKWAYSCTLLTADIGISAPIDDDESTMIILSEAYITNVDIFIYRITTIIIINLYYHIF